MFDKLLAVCLLVENFEKSLKFYRDTLGLKVKSQEGNQFAGFDLEGTEMAIFQKDGATAMLMMKSRVSCIWRLNRGYLKLQSGKKIGSDLM